MACLGDDTIAAMLDGGLGDDGSRHARDHIAGCDACRRLVSAAIDAGPTLDLAATQPMQKADTIRPGAVIGGRFRIERELGEGGMGRVYAARQIGLERPVAIKILLPELTRNHSALVRFRREARLIAALASDHVVRVHDLGEMPSGEPYLVMEMLDGEDLSSTLERGPVSVPQAVAWIAAACDAVGEAHSLGMVHRDLKPSNLFVTGAGKLKVLDFGLAKLMSSNSMSSTKSGMILGSPHYMAPEQIGAPRDVDHRADIWSLGATLYHLVTGMPPFTGPSIEGVFASILSGRQPTFAPVPPSLAAVIACALAAEPSNRFATARDFAHALYASQQVVPSAPQPHVAHTKSHRPTLLIALVGGVLLVGTIILVAVRPWASEPKVVAKSGLLARMAEPGSGEPGSDEPAPARAPNGAGVLGNLDETRLQRRLVALGWKISQTTHDSFPLCNHTRFLIAKDKVINADVFLLECSSPENAVSEGARLRNNFSGSWVVDDDQRVLMVELSTEKESKQLYDALIVP